MCCEGDLSCHASFYNYPAGVGITDPPYYDAIPYADLMDFFYVWLRRTLHGLSTDIDAAFVNPLAPKWDHNTGDGELIDDLLKSGCGVYACLNSSRRATAGFSWPRSPDGRTGMRCAGRALVGLLGTRADAARPEYPTDGRRRSPERCGRIAHMQWHSQAC